MITWKAAVLSRWVPLASCVDASAEAVLDNKSLWKQLSGLGLQVCWPKSSAITVYKRHYIKDYNCL